jgi:hypothetical protein
MINIKIANSTLSWRMRSITAGEPEELAQCAWSVAVFPAPRGGGALEVAHHVLAGVDVFLVKG